jgi:hypothetical protein
MKSFRIAICALILLSIGVFTNSSYIERLTEDFVSEIDEICENDTEKAKHDIERIYKKFKKAEKIISITTSHDDLTTIEEGFAEMIGAVHADDMTAVITIKSRLKSSFQHLGRLSGINIDSLI